MIKYQLIETGALIVFFIITQVVVRKALSKVAKRIDFQPKRTLIIKKLLMILITTFYLLILSVIWGVDQTDLVLFISSTLTILGVAFFAQWSLLSNVTATLILFFYYPVKIGDEITILDKDYALHGVITDIGIFIITIETDDEQLVTIPSSVFIQKMISRRKKTATKSKDIKGSFFD